MSYVLIWVLSSDVVLKSMLEDGNVSVCSSALIWGLSSDLSLNSKLGYVTVDSQETTRRTERPDLCLKSVCFQRPSNRVFWKTLEGLVTRLVFSRVLQKLSPFYLPVRELSSSFTHSHPSDLRRFPHVFFWKELKRVLKGESNCRSPGSWRPQAMQSNKDHAVYSDFFRSKHKCKTEGYRAVFV